MPVIFCLNSISPSISKTPVIGEHPITNPKQVKLT